MSAYRHWVGLAIVLWGSSCTGASNPEIPAPPTPLTSETDNHLAGPPARCSREPVPLERREVRAVGFARGDGPVFVGLGSADVVKYAVDTREHDGWHYYKTLWAISPQYDGAVRVTGMQLDGSNELRFNAAAGFPGGKELDLEFGVSKTREWRYGPSDTLIRRDGCYAFRIEGDDFIDWVTFIARS